MGVVIPLGVTAFTFGCWRVQSDTALAPRFPGSAGSPGGWGKGRTSSASESSEVPPGSVIS